MASTTDRDNSYNNMFEMFDSIKEIEKTVHQSSQLFDNFVKSSPFKVTVEGDDFTSTTDNSYDSPFISTISDNLLRITNSIEKSFDVINDFVKSSPFKVVIEESNQQGSAHNNNQNSEFPTEMITIMSDSDRTFFKTSFDSIIEVLKKQPTTADEEDNNEDVLRQIKKSGKDIQKSSNVSDSLSSLLGGLGNFATAALGAVTSAISSGVNNVTKIFNDMGRRAMDRYQTQEDSLNDIMYQYGLSDPGTAKKMYQRQFNVHSGHMTESERRNAVLPFQHRTAPEQREFNRNQRQSAIKMGYNTEESVKAVTSELVKWKDVFEDINFESSELFNQTMRFIDKTGGTFNEIMSHIQKVSTQYMVTPELLEEVSSGYARYMRTITKNNNSYTKSMNNMMTTVGKLEDAGVESKGFLEQIKTFQMSDVNNASQQSMWKQFSVLGMDPYSQITNDPGKVLEKYTSELKDYFKGYDISKNEDRLMVNTLAQEVLGMNQSEMENLYSLLDSNYQTEADKDQQLLTGIGTINDYQERIANEAAAYYDTATSGLWYITNQMATDAQSTLRDLTNPALAEWYEMTQMWYSNTDGLIEFPDKAYTMMGAQMVSQGQTTQYLANTLGGVAQTYMNVMSPIYDVLGQILSEISEDPVGFVTGTLGEITGGLGGIIGGAGDWLGSGIGGIFTGEGLSGFNSDNFMEGYEGGFKVGTLGTMDYQDHMDNGTGLAASIGRYAAYGDTTARDKVAISNTGNQMDSILAFDPGLSATMKASEIFSDSDVADYTNALNKSSNVPGNSYNSYSSSKPSSSYSTSKSYGSKSNPFKKKVPEQKGYNLPVHKYKGASGIDKDKSNTKEKIKTQKDQHSETNASIKNVQEAVKSTSSTTNKTLNEGITNIGTYYTKWTKLFNETYKTYTGFLTSQNKTIKESISNFSSAVSKNFDKVISSLSGATGLVNISSDNEKHNKKINDILHDLFQKDNKTGGYLWNLSGLVPTDNASGGGSYNPFSSYNITSKYGNRKDSKNGKKEFHSGVDYDIPNNTKLQALDSGIVLFSGSNDQYGNYIDLQGNSGYIYRYAHLNQRSVKEGDSVNRGDILGKSGSTGKTSKGPHLHLEITNPSNNLMDPLSYFKSNAVPITTSNNNNQASDGGSFPTYSITDEQAKGIAGVLKYEQGQDEKAFKAEVSLLANLVDKDGKKHSAQDVVNKVKGAWFGASRAPGRYAEGTTNQSLIKYVKDVLVDGKRTLPRYIDEHDCFSDILSATNNGSSVSVSDRSSYQPNVTKVKNRYGSNWIFYEFPTSSSDPFGYTSESLRNKFGDAHFSIDGTSQSGAVPSGSSNNGIFGQILDRLGLGNSSSFSNGASAEENAKKAYSYLKSLGMPNTNIAGILGNWTVESGIDPTTIEGYYSEKYTMSSTKQGYADDLSNYTLNKLFPLYSGRVSINKNAYKASDGKYYPGIGLGQWTGPRAKSLIDVASGKGRKWYDLAAQLDFMVNEDSRSSWIKNWINSEESSPENAASTFLSKWEGIMNGTLGKRQSSAKDYFNKMSNWTTDTSGLNTTGSGGVSFLNQLAMILGGNTNFNGTSGTAGATGARASVISFAKSKLGTPYVWGASGPNYYDCSGFVSAALNQAGLKVGRIHTSNMRGNVTNVSSASQLKAGDIMMGNSGKHTGIYVGDNTVIHSSGGSSNTVSNPGKGVTTSTWSPYWYAKWNGPSSAYFSGGEIDKPTLSLMGEGGYNEYVITTDPQFKSKSHELIAKAALDTNMDTTKIGTSQSSDPIIDVNVDVRSIVEAVETLSDIVKEGFDFIRRTNQSDDNSGSTKQVSQKSNVITNYT